MIFGDNATTAVFSTSTWGTGAPQLNNVGSATNIIQAMQATGFQIGDAVCLRARKPDNEGRTVIKRTLVARSGNRFKLDRPLRENLWLQGEATDETLELAGRAGRGGAAAADSRKSRDEWWQCRNPMRKLLAED